MIHSKALMKLLKMTGGVPERHITVNEDSLHIIPDGQLSPEEIEELRSVEEWRHPDAGRMREAAGEGSCGSLPFHSRL